MTDNLPPPDGPDRADLMDMLRAAEERAVTAERERDEAMGALRMLRLYARTKIRPEFGPMDAQRVFDLCDAALGADDE